MKSTAELTPLQRRDRRESERAIRRLAGKQQIVDRVAAQIRELERRNQAVKQRMGAIAAQDRSGHAPQ